MWHWRLDVLFKKSFTFSKKQQFFVQLCILVCIAHLFFFMIATLLSYICTGSEKYRVSLQSHSTLYVLLPLQKHIEQKKQFAKITKCSISASKVIELQTFLQELEKQKTQPVQEISQKKQPILELVESQEIVEPKKVEVVKEKKKSSQSQVRIIDKQVARNHEKEERLIETAKKKKLVEDTKTDQLTEQCVKQEFKKIEQDLQKSDLDLDNATFVGYEDLNKLTVQESITRAVQQKFRPPVGMSSDVFVELGVQVGKQGAIEKVDVIRSSGIVVYDLSARAALYKTVLPQAVWGKKITIVLGQ